MTGHIAIPAIDLGRSKAFYAVLGFSQTKAWKRPDWGLTGCIMEHGSGMNIELIHHLRNREIRFPEIAEVLHVGIPVRDLASVLQKLADLGAVVVRPISPGITVRRLAFIKDPSGVTVELFEPM